MTHPDFILWKEICFYNLKNIQAFTVLKIRIKKYWLIKLTNSIFLGQLYFLARRFYKRLIFQYNLILIVLYSLVILKTI